MKKTLFVTLFLAACGSHKQQPQQPQQPVAATEPARAIEPENPTPRVPDEDLPPSPDTTYAAPTPLETTPAPAPEPAKMLTAKAELKNVKTGESMGTVTFEEGEGGMITITADVTGLKKNSTHALYIHENGDCSAKGKKVGAHLNPTNVKHGPPASSTRHAGDFGDVTADETGHVTFTMMTDSLTMNDIGRADTIVNRSVVIHTKKDDKKGNAGAPLACGVITLESQ